MTLVDNLLYVPNGINTCLVYIRTHFMELMWSHSNGSYFLSSWFFPQGVDLVYLQTGISGVFLGFEFRKSVFFWYWSDLLYFLGCQTNAVVFKCFTFSTVFLGPVLFTRYFSKHSSSLLSSHT